jgi:hypothetical protein
MIQDSMRSLPLTTPRPQTPIPQTPIPLSEPLSPRLCLLPHTLH